MRYDLQKVKILKRVQDDRLCPSPRQIDLCEGANIIFVGRFGNVVSDDSFHLDACFSFLSNILSICIATKRKNIGAGAGGAQPPFVKHYVFTPHPTPLPQGERELRTTVYTKADG